ncbi:alpha-hydroxy acid oxidase [Streptomyces sp.]|uniref:alpha-hydroxy acid oxidase n=1 Tax=Streptomyces sp. TaxID=1931 RepID=UPI002C6A977B|nr:alpha-hydroxy acid oxidase [Streptomyces sp.]HLL34970.1 alpha-hydroxy acid oxidase [Streptomyces sp.]HZF89355.1 alpha-hydroxy acid oxidase [Streptomyces sp.]
MTRPVPVCLEDLSAAAAALLPPEVWGYVAGGAGDESTVHLNTESLRTVRLVPRVLADVRERSTRVRLLRDSCALPLGIAPMAYQKLLHPEGETAMARAAKRAEVPFVLPMLSSVALEQVAEVGGTLWLQLYWLRDRGRLRELVRRAEAAGVSALMLTADMPVMGRRLRDLRNGFGLPDHIHAANFDAEQNAAARQRHEGTSAIAGHTALTFDPSLNWSDVEWLRSRTRLPLIVKGVLHPQDAVRAVAAGADAVVVSNHGGRQFDRSVPAAAALPGVRRAVGDGCLVLFDGGIRSGSDILCALALGADAVLLGRPALWALAVGAEETVAEAVELLRAELDTAMAVTGCRTLADARGLTVRD